MIPQPAFSRLSSALFRANPAYELVPYERLSASDQRNVASLTEDRNFYGLLRPVGGAVLRTKAVDCDTALLIYTLQQPGPLPSYLTREAPEGIEEQLLSLVLDGVLEIRWQERYISGPEALAVLERPTPDASNAAARLANEALQLAQQLTPRDPTQLAGWLYGYNQIPLSPRWRAEFPNREAVERYLGIDADGANSQALAERWQRTPLPKEQDVWFMWYRHPQKRRASDAPTYKLYVSPHPNALRPVFDEVVAHLSRDAAATAFKIGNNAHGLLRPDKLVLYFATREALQASADALIERLLPYPAHGVPFTAPLSDDGMLSWGIDPPRHAQHPLTQGRESWRYWIATKLALALHSAWQADIPGLQPWQFALERLRLDGIDVASWQPLLNLLDTLASWEETA